MPKDLRQLGTPIETKDGAQSKVDSHENSTSGVHGVGGSDVASTADVAEKADDPHGNEAHSDDYTTQDDVDDAKGRVQSVPTLDDLPDADEEELGTRYFVEEENQSYEVTADE